MKLRNSTSWPDHFLRRMVSWCCQQLEFPVSRLKLATFRNSKSTFGGLAYHYQMRIGVCVGPASEFPYRETLPVRGNIYRTMEDREECLVNVTAHEIRHLFGHIEGERTRRKWKGSGELQTEFDAQRVLAAFRANREALMAEWSNPPAAREAKPKPSIQEQRAAKVQAALEKWERKLKLAKTKVTQYRRKARYYERAAASTPKS